MGESINFSGMRWILIALMAYAPIVAQVRPELTPRGFDPVVIDRPAASSEKLLERAREWAANYHRRDYDIYDISEDGLKVDAIRNNAFYYRSRGETYFYNIRYTVDFSCNDQTCTVGFVVKEIFVKQTVSKKRLADFFTPEGKLRSEFLEVKPSLEETARGVLNSFINFIR